MFGNILIRYLKFQKWNINLIKIQNVLTLIIISSFLISIQYSTIKFANGDTENDSNILIYNSNMDGPVLVNSNNTILKPKVEMSLKELQMMINWKVEMETMKRRVEMEMIK